MSDTTLLGKLIDDKQHRDAIHIAVAPVVAAQKLYPGQDIGFVLEGNAFRVGICTKPIGIADPFLKQPIQPEQWFYMLLYPRTITTLRHEWTHPAFAKENPDPTAQEKKDFSKRWLDQYAAAFELLTEDVLDIAKSWLANNYDYYTLNYDTPDVAYTDRKEFWKHFEILTGIAVPEDKKEGVFFTCAC